MAGMRSGHAWALAALVAGLATGVAPAAVAGPITLDTWFEFGFGEVVDPVTGCDPSDPLGPFCIPSSGTPTVFLDAPPWTFTAASSTVLTVTDAFFSGDRFEVRDFGASLGATSAPGAGVECGDDPVDCLATAGISHGSFTLAPGPHSLSLVTLASDGGGAGYLLVSAGAVVSEPASAALLAVALGGLALARRRRPASHRAGTP